MKENYFKSIVIIQRLNYLFLEVLKAELKRMGIFDITNIECLMIYKINDKKMQVGEITSLGCYLGTNVNYTLRKMVRNDYIVEETSYNDRRCTYIKLSEKGLNLRKKIDDLLESHAHNLFREGAEMIGCLLEDMSDRSKYLEDFWKNLLRWDN